MEEVWKTIISSEGYQISSLGQVKNVISGKILKTCFDGGGYLIVSLRKNGVKKTCKIHRLVGLHFIPNPDNKPLIDHKNRIKTDNRIDNLRWATTFENNQNQSLFITNKLRERNIHKKKDRELWRFKKVIDGIEFVVYFKTLEEAKNYRDEYYANLPTI